MAFGGGREFFWEAEAQCVMEKPNILYILADDLGYGDVSANNEGMPFSTKHIDRIAREGMRYTDAHASSAVCSPSRYSLLTGRYNWRSSLKQSVLSGYSEPLIIEGRKTLASFLKQQGYRTHAIGKWHLGMSFPREPGFVEASEWEESGPLNFTKPIENGPTTRGFDTFYGISGSLDMPPYVYIEDDHFTEIPTRRTKSEGMAFWRWGLSGDSFKDEHVLDHLTDKAIDLIRASDGTPFFLYLALPAPHTPILPSERFQGTSHTNAYGDFVLHCDDVVGRILSLLDEKGLSDSTLVVFSSDNGCSWMADFETLKQHGHNPSYHFRGLKSDIFEGGHRVPCLMRWPHVIPPNTVTHELTGLFDLYATLAEYFHYALQDDEAVDSVSMLSLLLDPEGATGRQSLVHQSADGSLSIRRGPWKLAMCSGSGGYSFPAPGSKEEATLPPFQLYNMVCDYAEQRNVASRYPEVVAHLRKELLGIIREGRSTPGPRQEHEGVQFWDTITWARKLAE